MLHRRSAIRARPMFWSAEFVAKIILLVPLLAGPPAVADDVLSKVVTVNIPAQALDTALMQLSKQTHLQVMLASTSVDGKFTKGVQGTMPVSAALTIMLRDSGMSFTADNQTVTVSPIANPKHGELTDKNSSRVAQTNQNEKPTEAQQDNSSPGDQAVGDKRSRKATDSEENSDRGLQEIVVTGTHIRGGDSASPVMVFTQYDFDQAGASTPQEFFATLPQIFQGGESETNTLNFTSNNPGYGSSVNLRGLGSGSTLVLIDGQRAALSGYSEFVDVSMIPLSAVERIEILTDGASAIYGSDAIGGVVNFIMRKDFNGADTGLRYGESTHGDAKEYEVTQAFGKNWGSGSVLLSYELNHRGDVNSEDREFSRDATGPLHGPAELVPDQHLNSGYLSLRQDINDWLGFNASALLSNREAHFDVFNVDFMEEDAVDNQLLGSTLGLTFNLGHSWLADLVADVSENKIDTTQDTPTHNSGLGLIEVVSRDRLLSIEAQANGTLLRLPSGDVKLAAGASYRTESYQSEATVGGAASPGFPKESANSKAAFAELRVPLLGPVVPGTDKDRLLLSLAGRYEDYNDFGRTVNPKIGLRWLAADSLVVRSTFGTSFKAPSVYQISPAFQSSSFDDVVDPNAPSGTTRALVEQGNNPNLTHETARTFTAGLEWSAPFVDGLKTDLNYFNILYKDRIGSLNLQVVTILDNPAYQSYVVRPGQVSAAQYAALVSQIYGYQPTPPFGCLAPSGTTCLDPPSSIDAIVDDRLQNIAVTRTSGLDWTVNDVIDSQVGRFGLNLNTSYLLKNEQQASPGFPFLELLNTPGFPVGLRARGSASWSPGDWSAQLAANYTRSYSNRGYINVLTGLQAPFATIASWTTFDFHLSYGSNSKLNQTAFGGVQISLNVNNLFDRRPPFFNDYLYGLGFDPSNADPIGRRISVLLRKSW
jgi:iron complex outermembrane receptor protein